MVKINFKGLVAQYKNRFRLLPVAGAANLYDLVPERGTVTHEGDEITAEAMNFMRGRSITDTWLIIDEAQNLTPRQVKGIVTRVGKDWASGRSIIDDSSNVSAMLDTRSNGLTYASARMRGSPLCVQLTMLPDECQRSPLALDAAVRM